MLHKLLRVSVLPILLSFLFSLQAEDKKIIQYWKEQKDDLVILHFSPEFPALSYWDGLCLLNELTSGNPKVFGLNLRQGNNKTTVSFLGKKANSLLTDKVISVIKSRLGKAGFEIREIQPSKDDDRSPITPTRAPTRVVFYL